MKLFDFSGRLSCPVCGADLSLASGPKAPEAGDATVCVECLSVLQYRTSSSSDIWDQACDACKGYTNDLCSCTCENVGCGDLTLVVIERDALPPKAREEIQKNIRQIEIYQGRNLRGADLN